jgi:uncharacterized protein
MANMFGPGFDSLQLHKLLGETLLFPLFLFTIKPHCSMLFFLFDIKLSKAIIITFSCIYLSTNSMAQVKLIKATPYILRLDSFQKKYVLNHEVVQQQDKKYINFYNINPRFCIQATFTRTIDTNGFIMKTANNGAQTYFVYGKIQFMLSGQQQQMFLYQSKMSMQMPKYKNYLFLPFLDATCGDESYGGGRYIDILTTEIKNNTLIVDFNKAYNPYCAYANGYKCPIPPKENILTIAINAGEKIYAKHSH